MFMIAAAIWILTWVYVTCFNLAAERQVGNVHFINLLYIASIFIPFYRQVFRIREEFFQAVLRQDMAWFDIRTSTGFANQLTEYATFS